MKKKSLDGQLNFENFNKTLFDQSIKMINSHKKIPLGDVQLYFKDDKVKQKYSKLESNLGKLFKIMGKFTQAEKPALNTQLDYGVQIFEETKILIETKIKRAKEESNTLKRNKVQQNKKEQRPQSLYPDMTVDKVFDRHEHQSYLQNSIIPEIQKCEQIIKANNIQANQTMYISNQRDLDQCITELLSVKQIAVDVEHSQRSYEGITCLIQISTRTKDYIIDVFPIWKSVNKLSKVIGNPKILKVMHGAEMDTKWLQRDFNIHIINLFDTHKAARYSGMTTLSYGHLLKQFCGVNTDKSFQRADWRVRNLTPEMIYYATTDTHYLLQIYDHLRIQLQKQSESMNLAIENVFKEIQKSSHEVTLIEVQLFSYKSKEIYQKLFKDFKKEYFPVVQKIFFILNKTAYENDESFDVLVTHRILNQVFSLVKDIIYNKNSKVSIRLRIDRIISALTKSECSFMTNTLSVIKQELQQFFIAENTKKQESETKNKKERFMKNKVPLIEKMIDEKDEQFQRQQKKLSFVQFKGKSFEDPIIKKPLNSLKPITLFLSQKFGIQKKHEENEDSAMQQQESGSNLEQNVQEINEQEQNGMIEFKRIKPNVIYTIEEPNDEGIKTMLPRKKRKELEYEKRLNNKVGNIYDLLEDN